MGVYGVLMKPSPPPLFHPQSPPRLTPYTTPSPTPVVKGATHPPLNPMVYIYMSYAYAGTAVLVCGMPNSSNASYTAHHLVRARLVMSSSVPNMSLHICKSCHAMNSLRCIVLINCALVFGLWILVLIALSYYYTIYTGLLTLMLSHL
jgi:hypothetical protein